jgi:exopolyphosphatase/guanosine-5'-triphosphate,3'-diphosphate pyrophosphatase
MRRHIRKVAEQPLAAVLAHAPVRVYGSSGSIHALAHAAHARETGEPIGQINGYVLTLESLGTLARSLQRMDLAERERLPGIDARRAEIIVPGAMTLLHVLEAVGANAITISDFGVREGLVMDYIISHQREITDLEKVADLRLRSVLRLLAKFHPTDDRHPQQVARLALMLFDALRREHGLGDSERDLLNYAALLHDVGSAIAYDRHARHSAYVIRNGSLRGFSGEEVEMIALIALHHAKGRPRKGDDAYASLPKPQRRAVRWLSAMLQIVEGLDRSHYQLIESIRVVRGRRRLSLLLSARRDAGLEFWAARRRTAQLERLLDMPITVKLDPASERRATARVEARKARAEADRPAGKRAAIVIPMRRAGKS